MFIVLTRLDFHGVIVFLFPRCSSAIETVCVAFQVTPEVVASAESFAADFTYVRVNFRVFQAITQKKKMLIRNL